MNQNTNAGRHPLDFDDDDDPEISGIQPTRDASPAQNPTVQATAAAEPRPAGDKRSGVSLSLIFILFVALATLAAIAAPAVHVFVSKPSVVVGPVFLVYGALGILIGAISGATHFRSIEGLLWGIVLGLVLGLYVGVVAFTPANRIENVVLPAMCGAMVIVGLAGAIRLSRRSSHADADLEQ